MNDKEAIVKSDVALREEKILQFWKENNIFQKTLEKEAPNGNFVFFDGPPFATGLPHYGHILASAIKDAVPRYWTMNGYHVERRWGWDCHGLPIENIVEKDLHISGKKEIEEYGVQKFNEYARSKVLDFVSHWKETVERIGRWVDFDGSYKTMDNTFIESVWWALKEINEKGLLYEGTRVLPYCPRCETPVANSEIAMDGSYKDITDISVYVKFELVDETGTYLLAWTTTPWSLPGDTALAINKEIKYVKVEYEGKFYIVAEERLKFVPILKDVEWKDGVNSWSIEPEKLIDKSYIPPFDYYKNIDLPNKENIWKIWHADFVTVETGTGIAHEAPVFGEEDMDLAKKNNIPFIYHVGHDGKFVNEVTDFAGIKVKPKEDHQSGDVLIIKNLAHKGFLFAKEKIIHSYPHCFRCETPLYYFAIPAWFIKISEVKERLLSLNEKIIWIPEHLKEGRFKKSMEGAPDWNISRNLSLIHI
jgi:isoleucyl-tRNA synthetase